jgi:hypothetical protein
MALSQKAKTETEILDRLLDSDFPANGETRSFAHQLFERFATKKQAQVSAYRQREEELLAKRRKNETYSLVQEDQVESSSGEEEPAQLKLFRDLEKIKSQRNEQEQIIAANAAEDPKLTKREDKEIKKLLKEKDKLERDAMVARMLEKDRD